jgi:hypothetical protein
MAWDFLEGHNGAVNDGSDNDVGRRSRLLPTPQPGRTVSFLLICANGF